MVITGANVPVGNRSARPGCVDEAVSADVDPHVIDVATVDTEKDEIAG